MTGGWLREFSWCGGTLQRGKWWKLGKLEAVGLRWFEMVWVHEFKSKLQYWGLKQMIPWKPNNPLSHPFTFNFVGCPSNIPLGYLRLIFSGRCRGRHLRGWILQLRCLGRYALYQRCLPQPILPGRLASNDLQWQSRNLIDLLWFIWTNLDEFGGC